MDLTAIPPPAHNVRLELILLGETLNVFLIALLTVLTALLQTVALMQPAVHALPTTHFKMDLA
jgi:hypothetical protein